MDRSYSWPQATAAVFELWRTFERVGPGARAPFAGEPISGIAFQMCTAKASPRGGPVKRKYTVFYLSAENPDDFFLDAGVLSEPS